MGSGKNDLASDDRNDTSSLPSINDEHAPLDVDSPMIAASLASAATRRWLIRAALRFATLLTSSPAGTDAVMAPRIVPGPAPLRCPSGPPLPPLAAVDSDVPLAHAPSVSFLVGGNSSLGDAIPDGRSLWFVASRLALVCRFLPSLAGHWFGRRFCELCRLHRMREAYCHRSGP